MAVSAVRSVASRRRLVELVGPAGAGKSTIAQLLRGGAGVRAAPGLWTLPRGPLGLNALRFLPRVLGFYRAFRGRVWDEMKQVIRLDTLYQVVGAPHGGRGEVWLLDEGPVLAFGWLTVFGDDRLRRPAFAAWLAGAVTRWASALDVVVLLDAPDAVLARRIRERAKPHDVKALPDGEVLGFIRSYRAALEAAVAALRDAGPLTVVRIDTGDDAPETTAARIRAELDRLSDGD